MAKNTPRSRSALAASTALPVAVNGVVDPVVPDAMVLGAVADDNLPGDLAADLATGPAVVPALIDGAVANAAFDGPVLLPASTGDGVVHEVSAVDALGLRETGDDAAGDRAAAIVSRPVAVAGAVVEPVNPGLGPHPGVDPDLAGDLAARSVVGVDPVLPVSPLGTFYTGEGSAVAVDMAAAPLDAVATETRAATLSALEPVEGNPSDFVVFDLTRPASEDDRASLQLVLDHIQASFPDYTLPGDARPIFATTADAIDEASVELSEASVSRLLTETALSTDEIFERASRPGFGAEYPRLAIALRAWQRTSDWDHPMLQVQAKTAGFRRGGISHPSEATRYFIGDLDFLNVEAILAEPMLVSDIV